MCHAIERAQQRYNKDYTYKDIHAISHNIRDGKIVGEAFKPKNDTGCFLLILMNMTNCKINIM